MFRERLSQLRVRLEEVGAERAPEYTEPLGGLQRSLKIRIQVAGLWAVPLPEPTALCPPSSLILPLPRPAPGCPLVRQGLPSASAGIYKGFCLDVIRNKYECELQGARQHLEVTVQPLGAGAGGDGSCAPARLAEPLRLFQSEKLLLYDTLQGELQERIQRLEEDRQSLDISSGEARGPLCPVSAARRQGLGCPTCTGGWLEDLPRGRCGD